MGASVSELGVVGVCWRLEFGNLKIAGRGGEANRLAARQREHG